MPTSRDLLSKQLKGCAEIFKHYGVALYDVVLYDNLWCKELEVAAMELPESAWIVQDTVGSEGDRVRGKILDHDGVMADPTLGRLAQEYKALRYEVGAISNTHPLLSEHTRSSFNIRLYEQGDSGGRHYDTQPLSALLFLTEGACLRIETLDGRVDVEPVPGRLAVFQGRKCLHGVLRSDEPQYRLTVPFNYYVKGDTKRPEHIDKMMYENMSYEDATR